MESIKNWMRDTANILFDDSKNDLRSLPKTVRLQILLVLSFIWTTVFSLYVFSYTTFVFGWTCLLYTSPSPRDRYISRMPSSA